MTAEIHDFVTRKNIASAKGLLQSLVPRAQCFCFYDRDQKCVWSSDGADDYEIDNYVAELPINIVAGFVPDAEQLRQTMPSGRTVLVLPVYDEKEEGVGLLIAVFSKNAGKSSWFNPSLLKGILQPAVDMIGESLRLNRKLAVADDRVKGIESELKLIYRVEEKVHGTSTSHAGFAELVGQSGRFLGIAYSVLLLPSKRIRISATHSSWKDVNRKAVDKYLVEKLMPKLEGMRSPVIYDVPEVEDSDDIAEKGYQALLCPLLDSSGNLEGVLAQLSRVDGTPFGQRHIRFMSHIMRKVEYVIQQSFDPMTGLMNRAGFESQLKESMKSLKKKGDEHQIIYFDIDNVQLVNDTFGRSAGDDVIVRFAQLLDEVLPKNAVATRLTGDDFAILMTDTKTEDALQLTKQFREQSRKLRYLHNDKSLQVTVSIGISAVNFKTTDEGNALTTARIACESAKDHGRDRVEIYNQDRSSIIRRHDDMHLVARIQQSIDMDGFVLLAQPIVSLKKGDSRQRYEILLRMQDNDGKMVSSGSLFSAAERYHLMPHIDRWVISSTLSRLSEHAEKLQELDLMFAINLSGQSLGDDEILRFVEQELASNGVAPESICFEITESAAVSNRRKAQVFIDALRNRGCRFSLDDFGAGLSSFAYLKNFNVDTLKIDGGFIRDITENRISESMVAAITQVAKVMELETVAEYVEGEATRKLIRKLGVDFAQGHLIGKPLPLDSTLPRLFEELKTSTA
ncbi:MAG: EAL domain-containing protein [Gammaproteobacteria bacterium]|nr:EAL domain-containing protein [Gammaproteobacteria bacterium]